MRYLALVGRLLYSVIFLVSGPFHFTAQYAGYAAQAGVPAASVLVPLAGVISLAGGVGGLPREPPQNGAGVVGGVFRPRPPAHPHFLGGEGPNIGQNEPGPLLKKRAPPGAPP